MIQAGHTDLKKDFLKLRSNKENKEKSDRKSEEELVNLGLAPDEAVKNKNPDLKVNKSEKRKEGE